MQYGRKVTYLYQPNRGVSAATKHPIEKQAENASPIWMQMTCGIRKNWKGR